MRTTEISSTLTLLFSELVDGPGGREAFMLNSGDAGFLKSLDTLSPEDASRSANAGATIAAHAQHVRYGLSLMNRWAAEGGDPFADAAWEIPWKTSVVDVEQWQEIRDGLRGEVRGWLAVLGSPREVSGVELAGMISSIAHLAYHLGAVRQIVKETRGPKERTYSV